MIIKKVKSTKFYDIFLQDGWKNWSRYRFDKEIYTHIAGNRLTRNLIEKIKKEITK